MIATDNIDKKGRTALSSHFNMGQKFDFNNVNVLDVDANYKKKISP